MRGQDDRGRHDGTGQGAYSHLVHARHTTSARALQTLAQGQEPCQAALLAGQSVRAPETAQSQGTRACAPIRRQLLGHASERGL